MSATDRSEFDDIYEDGILGAGSLNRCVALLNRTFAQSSQGDAPISPWERTPVCAWPISKIMTTGIVTADWDMSLDEAREVLLSQGMFSAPVAGQFGNAIGSISLCDLARAEQTFDVAGQQTGQRFQSEFGGEMDHAFLLAEMFGPTVADVMTPDVLQLPENAPIARAATLMEFEDVSQIVVTDADDAICGIISADDIWFWVAQETGHIDAAAGQASPESVQVSSEQRRTVLVVEDDDAICEGLIDVLCEAGYAGVKALDGEKALEILDSMPTRPGLILLDLMMPRMNGWEFREAQVKDRRIRSIPVVVLTAHAKGKSTARLQSPAAYLRKPIDVDTLLQTVDCNFSSPI